MDTKRRGDSSEARVISELISYGFDVFTPFGENTRSDLIVDNDGDLYRIQVKTGNHLPEDGVVEFACANTRSNYTESVEESYEGDIDAFAVYCPTVDNVYWIPIGDAPNSKMKLRLSDPKLSNPNINWADEYELKENAPA